MKQELVDDLIEKARQAERKGLATSLAIIEQKVSDGFKRTDEKLDGVNAHLKELNGKTYKSEQRIDCLENKHHEMEGIKKGRNNMWAFVVGTIGLLLTLKNLFL